MEEPSLVAALYRRNLMKDTSQSFMKEIHIKLVSFLIIHSLKLAAIETSHCSILNVSPGRKS